MVTRDIQAPYSNWVVTDVLCSITKANKDIKKSVALGLKILVTRPIIKELSKNWDILDSDISLKLAVLYLNEFIPKKHIYIAPNILRKLNKKLFWEII